MTSIAKVPTHSLNHCKVAITLKEQTRILQGNYINRNITTRSTNYFRLKENKHWT